MRSKPLTTRAKVIFALYGLTLLVISLYLVKVIQDETAKPKARTYDCFNLWVVPPNERFAKPTTFCVDNYTMACYYRGTGVIDNLP